MGDFIEPLNNKQMEDQIRNEIYQEYLRLKESGTLGRNTSYIDWLEEELLETKKLLDTARPGENQPGKPSEASSAEVSAGNGSEPEYTEDPCCPYCQYTMDGGQVTNYHYDDGRVYEVKCEGCGRIYESQYIYEGSFINLKPSLDD